MRFFCGFFSNAVSTGISQYIQTLVLRHTSVPEKVGVNPIDIATRNKGIA
jgi:hypothetical protein